MGSIPPNLLPLISPPHYSLSNLFNVSSEFLLFFLSFSPSLQLYHPMLPCESLPLATPNYVSEFHYSVKAPWEQRLCLCLCRLSKNFCWVNECVGKWMKKKIRELVKGWINSIPVFGSSISISWSNFYTHLSRLLWEVYDSVWHYNLFYVTV